jgi:hypothetical protein
MPGNSNIRRALRDMKKLRMLRSGRATIRGLRWRAMIFAIEKESLCSLRSLW